MRSKIGNRLITSLKTAAKPFEVRDTELKGFLLRVQPSGVMTFICDYRTVDGRRNRISLGRVGVLTPAQARDEAKKILGEVACGKDPAKVRAALKVSTFENFIVQRYEPWVTAHRKSGQLTVQMLKSTFLFLFARPLNEVSPWLVEKWRTERLKSGITPQTVNRNLTALKAALGKAVEWDFLAANPLAKVKASKVDSIGSVRYLDYDEEVRLRTALEKRDRKIRIARINANRWRSDREYPELPMIGEQAFADHLTPMVLVSLNTGVRRGELFKLKWEDINFTTQSVLVRSESSKSGLSRHIALNQEAMLTFCKWRAQTQVNHGLVFPGKDGNPLDNIKKSWAGLVKLAELNDFRWHDLRHHFASRLVIEGVDLNTVRELLGHKDIKMTLRYAHLSPGKKAEAVARLDFNRQESRNGVKEATTIFA